MIPQLGAPNNRSEEDTFLKVIVENGIGRILGAHAIGPHAAIQVQQLAYVINVDEGTYLPLARAQTIHPALSEIVVGALGSAKYTSAQEHHHH
jgi:pyruvate/2-oxoglutarate dehydrogenase complex dihydrolipoamide dehydrogenase (E3) component